MKILLILVILFEGLAFSGPNQNAVLSVDLLTGSAVPDSALSMTKDNGPVWVAVRVAQSVGLDSYGFEVGFDSSLLTFIEAVPASTPDALPNFLESRGGIPLGFVGKLSNRNANQVTIAHSLIGSDSVQSPSGAGIVALIRFQPRGKAGVAVFTLGLPQLLDWKLQLDTAIVVQGAKLTLTSVVGINSRYESNRPGALATTFLSLAGTRDLLGRIPYSRRTPEEIVFPF